MQGQFSLLLFCVRFKFHACFQPCMTFKSLLFVCRGGPLTSQFVLFTSLQDFIVYFLISTLLFCAKLKASHSLYVVLHNSYLGQWLYGKRFWVERIPRVEVSWVPLAWHNFYQTFGPVYSGYSYVSGGERFKMNTVYRRENRKVWNLMSEHTRK